VCFLGKAALQKLTAALKTQGRQARLPGKQTKQGTLYFERNAQALARKAQELAQEKQDTVVAVLFRDSDGTGTSWGDENPRI
jgi:hypothetical protein